MNTTNPKQALTNLVCTTSRCGKKKTSLFLRTMGMVTLLGLIGCAGERPTGLGNSNGELATCPDSPNCVSSFESRESHLIAPIKSSLDAIEKVLLDLPEANIIETADNYLYVEFTSKIIGYVDDVEFLYDPREGVVQVRSASRLGHSDMGVNRKRIESIRAAVSN